ncbi:hypothetical protein D3C83_64030 [compost metagenome]
MENTIATTVFWLVMPVFGSHESEAGEAGEAPHTTRSAGFCVRLHGAALACWRVKRAGAAPHCVAETA